MNLYEKAVKDCLAKEPKRTYLLAEATAEQIQAFQDEKREWQIETIATLTTLQAYVK